MDESLKLWQFLAVQFPFGVLLVAYTLALASMWGKHEEYLYQQILDRIRTLEQEITALADYVREHMRGDRGN